MLELSYRHFLNRFGLFLGWPLGELCDFVLEVRDAISTLPQETFQPVDILLEESNAILAKLDIVSELLHFGSMTFGEFPELVLLGCPLLFQRGNLLVDCTELFLEVGFVWWVLPHVREWVDHGVSSNLPLIHRVKVAAMVIILSVVPSIILAGVLTVLAGTVPIIVTIFLLLHELWST